MSRKCGVLLPITSLPSRYGIGAFTKEAYSFVDLLKSAGQTYWQILPLGVTSFGDSPYQSFSTFAGNPYMISLERMCEQGLLSNSELESADFGDDPTSVDYEKLYKNRFTLLRLAYSRDNPKLDENFLRFCDQNSFWLDDFALFMSVKDHYGGLAYYEWDNKLKYRVPEALEAFEAENNDSITFHKYLQYRFFSEWYLLKEYANKNGIKIIGDIPIYVSRDSTDVWAEKELFQLDEQLNPTFVSGCPPDSFSECGQLWGNPLYNWSYHKSTGFEWWKRRMTYALKMFDMLRIDHFRGFDEYYSIPFGDETAVGGRWEKAPGFELFESLQKIVPSDRIIAEDLGFITESVRRLVRFCGFKNMKIIEFGFDSRDKSTENEHLPHNYQKNSVVYTATHDNQTLISWYNTITADERRFLRSYLNDSHTPDDEINIPLIALAYRSVADICIIPMQDWLGLDDRARMNTPSTTGCNWKWRLDKVPEKELAAKMHNFAEIFSR